MSTTTETTALSEYLLFKAWTIWTLDFVFFCWLKWIPLCDKLNSQSSPCFVQTLTFFFCLLQLLAVVAPQSRVFLCPCWPGGVGDLDLFPVHRDPPEAQGSQRMHRNHPVHPCDWKPACTCRKHQPPLHRLSGGAHKSCCYPRGPVLPKDTVLGSGGNPLPVSGSVVLWSYGNVADRAHQFVV